MSSYSGRFRLKIDDEGRSRLVPIRLGAVTIGRDPDNTIRIEDRNVSRRHLRLTREARQIWVEDLSSANGTRVNGELVKGRACLYRNDVIQVGDLTLEIDGESLKARNDDTTERTEAPDLEDTRVDVQGTAKPEVTEIVDRSGGGAPVALEVTPRPAREPTELVDRRRRESPAAPSGVLVAVTLVMALVALVFAAALVARRSAAPVGGASRVEPVAPMPNEARPQASGPSADAPAAAAAAAEQPVPQAETIVSPPDVVQAPGPMASSRDVKVRRTARPTPSLEQGRVVAEKLNAQAEALVKAGDAETAKPLLKRCLKADPTFGRCHRTLGIIYARLGDTPTAAYHYGRYIDLAPDAPDAAEIRKLLAAYRGSR